MSNNVLVSIITVTYNSEKTISKAIESVLNQSYDKIDYIIMDGASTDNTVSIANSYKEQFKKKGYSYRVISEPDNGMYDALNKAAKMADGELVGQINSDDWYENDAVEKMEHLYEKEKYDVAWGSIRIHKRSGTIIKKAHIGKLWTTAGFCHPAMFSKKEILLKYPYALENMYDDFDFATRVYLDKKKICTTEEMISNFTFGGMSNRKSWKECKKRIGLKWHGYKKYNMSPIYWIYCFVWETLKFILA